MKFLRIIICLLLAAVVTGCSKGGNGDGSTPVSKITPSNLAVTSATDASNTGTVAFAATANNAVSYNYDFGDGSAQTTTATGSINYKYFASGTYTVKVTAKSNDGLTAIKSISVTVTVVPVLTWDEEFNIDGAPDPAKWGYDTGNGVNGWGNSELEYYTDRASNVTVSGGTLKITARKEAYNGYAYTSTRLLTNNKFSFKYGKLEVKAKLPAGAGTWPAIWTLGNNFMTNYWPACGEMDIMEHRGNELNKIFGTFHYPGHSGANGSGSTVMVPNVTTEFHRYAIDWQPATIKFLVDDVPFYILANNSSLPFNQNFFVILNVAMGGNFGGAVDPAFNSATMEIDYVRLYQ